MCSAWDESLLLALALALTWLAVCIGPTTERCRERTRDLELGAGSRE